MALSKFITTCLFGMVVLNSSTFAKGTPAGTEIVVTPVIEYVMGGKTIKEQVVKSKYIVDKLIEFKVTRALDLKQTTVKGLTFLAPFNVTKSNKIIGQGVYNKRKNSVDFTIKELRGGEAVYPHVVTVIR